MKLVLASKNAKKLKEMNEILSGMGVEVCSQADIGVDVDVEETGETFAANAMLKAMERSDYIENMAALGLQLDNTSGEAYAELLNSQMETRLSIWG